METRYKTLIKDTFIFAIGAIGSKIILFFLVPLYTKYLSTEQYGVADLIFTIAQLIIPFASITIYNGVLRFGLSKDINKEDSLVVGFIITSIGSIVTILITPILGIYTAIADWKWYICIYVILSCFNLIQLNYLKIEGKNKVYTIINIIQTLILAITNIILLIYMSLGIEGYILSNIIALLCSTILGFIFGKIPMVLRKGKFQKKLCKEMIFYSAPVIVNDISWWLIHSSDKIMIEAMIGTATLGLYTVATKIPSLINVLISIFSQAWGISAVKEIETTNEKNFYTNVFQAYCFLVFGISIIVILVIKYFMKIYVSSEFFEAWKLVPLLIASAAFSAISTYYGSLYGALKKNLNVMITTIIAALANIILNYIFIKIIGIWGAIIGTVSAYFIISFIRMIDISRYIKIDLNWKNYILNVILIMGTATVISFDYYTVLFSIIALVAFIIINFKMLVTLKSKLKIRR